jgi:hypothetical protein
MVDFKDIAIKALDDIIERPVFVTFDSDGGMYVLISTGDDAIRVVAEFSTNSEWYSETIEPLSDEQKDEVNGWLKGIERAIDELQKDRENLRATLAL